MTRKEVWDDVFELTGYDKGVRVVRSLEPNYNNGKESVQELYVVTNMLNHDVETILKYRLKIEISVFWDIIFKIFERDFHSDKTLIKLFNPPG